ncbi:MAG: Uma2 family endonuclease [Owenweeksia sp.]|nr:Uma2 family endonuclease [Owenweeksia sp.]
MDYPKQDDRTSEVHEPDLSGTYTAKDYITWQVDELLELIRGKIFKMSPSPLVNHQRVHSRLHLQMAAKPRHKDKCEIFQAPLDVYLIHPGEDWQETQNIVEPDLFIVCDPSKINRRGCMGAPDFVVEILSPGTSKKDASLKMELYEEYGVREYWIDIAYGSVGHRESPERMTESIKP